MAKEIVLLGLALLAIGLFLWWVGQMFIAAVGPALGV